MAYVIRAPRPDETEAVFSVFESYNTGVLGFADCTLDDIVENFAEPGFDLTTDAWLALDEGGSPAGYGCVLPGTEGVELHIEVAAADPDLARRLLGLVADRSRAIGRQRGHDSVALDIGVYRADTAMRTLVTDAGFGPGTTFHRMRIDHIDPVPSPELPDGVVLRRGDHPADPDGGDAVRRAGHRILEETFAGQFSIHATSYDEWVAVRDARPTFDWSQLVVLELDGEPVAAREDTDGFVEDTGCGFVQRLGVLEVARGRGLAKLLLRDAFATHAAAGRAGTLLHVDTNNPTPALDLYTSVGMEPVLVIDVLRAVLSTSP